MGKKAQGLYEALLTEALAAELGALPPDQVAELRKLRPDEAADRLALHVARALRRSIDDVDDAARVRTGIALVRALLEQIETTLGAEGDPKADPQLSAAAGAEGEAEYAIEIPASRGSEFTGDLAADRPVVDARVLTALLARGPDGKPRQLDAPLIPLLDTTLLTNAPDEPRVGQQIATELDSADRIDVVMAFVRRSGLRPLLPALRRATSSGRRVRVLTTTYTGSTELAALEDLAELGAEVRVSYDTTSTRLHAKAWLFHRESGMSTAYIGSSNLTHSAHVTGLEWNVRVSGARNPDVTQKIAAVFEGYWQGGDFRPFDRAEFVACSAAAANASSGQAALHLSPIELRLEPFQERLLEEIELERERGHHRNLLVAATGTGKTVMAAVDYARLRPELPRARLLFVAHRRELLEQSRATFRHALRDAAFGELWVDGHHPTEFEHVFASIQSLSNADLSLLAPDHFDVVVVDEFHHAAAKSYERLLAHVRPRELLGLTATPERADGLTILDHFDGRIAAELRLWDAIDQHRLVPFLYYGLHDGLDLREVPWRRGKGYDIEALSKLLTADERLAREVLAQLARHVDDVARIRCLGFCVSVAHARFMARVFVAAGVHAEAVWGDSPPEDRAAALRGLADGKLQFLFSVDLFNEGVDVPQVDTLLLLRPTDSPTLFLQQLGRGLRRAHGKSACTVLDFVGHHRKEFRIDVRYRALLGGSRRELRHQELGRTELAHEIESGFPFLPAGCHMELDAVARKLVLDNIRNALPSTWQAKANELRALAAAEPELSLSAFLQRSGLELDDVYAKDRSWSELRADAGLPPLSPPRIEAGVFVPSTGPHERELRRAIGRLLHVDDALRITGYAEFLRSPTPPNPAALSRSQRRLLRMLVASVVDQVASRHDDLLTGVTLLWAHPQVRGELLELLDALHERVTHRTHELRHPAEVPLRIHARYTRLEILAALGAGEDRATVANWQSGVQWVGESNCDVFAFTLDKSSGHFSPTTRYRDYAISRERIHWESQSVTREESETGRRYREHVARGSSVLLFARHRQSERAFHFLGPARYVEHQGERPMRVVWQLEQALPGDLFASFAAAVA